MPADHILTYAQTLAGGGVERAQLRLMRDWIAAGRRVTLVIGSPHGPLAAELPAGVVTVAFADSSYWALFALPRHVQAIAPDLIFCPGNHYSVPAWWTRKVIGRATPPIVAKMSNAFVRPDQGLIMRLSYRWWLRLHPRFLDRLVAMTPAMRDEAIAISGFAPDCVVVIPNPPAHRNGGLAPDLPAGRIVLGVGRLAPQKRWDRLIDAVADLPMSDVALVILGDGDEREALEAQAERRGIADRCHFPGHVAEPLAAMARASVVALTSDFEGVPGVLREALSVGTPVVTTDSSAAVGEIVADPTHGTIVARADHPALVAALSGWLDPARARPDPVDPGAHDSAARYLDLFDSLVDQRSA